MEYSPIATGWVCVATEGTTIDGRKIERCWIVDLAETYNPKLYTALIWEEHNRDLDNLGEVLEARCENSEGLMKLYVRLRPTSKLMSYNERGQKLFCSIEVEDDFRDSGRFYLGGLAVTDSPASIGTDRLKFSVNKRYFARKGSKTRISNPIAFSLADSLSMSGKGWVSAISGN